MNLEAMNRVTVDITVVLGRAHMPVRQLLKMGRGAVIDLDAKHEDECWIYANGELVARGEIMIIGERIGVSVTRMMSQLEI